jgi:hypothetical protein
VDRSAVQFFVVAYVVDRSAVQFFVVDRSAVPRGISERSTTYCPVAVLAGKTLYWPDSLEERSVGEMSHHPAGARVNWSRRFRVTCLGGSWAARRLPIE